MRVPDHDLLIQTVQSTVREAVRPLTGDEVRVSLYGTDLSYSTVYKLLHWRPGKGSFRYDTLTKLNDWATSDPRSKLVGGKDES